MRKIISQQNLVGRLFCKSISLFHSSLQALALLKIPRRHPFLFHSMKFSLLFARAMNLLRSLRETPAPDGDPNLCLSSPSR